MPPDQTALFNFTSLLLVILLLIWYDQPPPPSRTITPPPLLPSPPTRRADTPNPQDRTERLTYAPHSTCAYLHQLFPAILDRNKTGSVRPLHPPPRKPNARERTATPGQRRAVLTSKQNHRRLLEVRTHRRTVEPIH